MVTVSDIVPRRKKVNSGANQVNNWLVLICKEKNSPFLSYDENFDTSKLHLINHCIKGFAENFCRPLVKLKLHQKITLIWVHLRIWSLDSN